MKLDLCELKLALDYGHKGQRRSETQWESEPGVSVSHH